MANTRFSHWRNRPKYGFGQGLQSGLVLVLSLVMASAGSALLPARYHQGAAPAPTQGLVGTDIGDIVWSGRYLWVATEEGLSRLEPAVADGSREDDWVTFTEENGLGRGSISALAAQGDTVWAASLVDSLIGENNFQVSTGLSVSTNGGASWRHISNEAIFDTTKAGFAGGPSTPVLNACFGLALDGDTVWGAFFAGSTVRSTDGGATWERVLPGGAERIVFFATETAADSLTLVADSLEQAGGAAAEIEALRVAADSLASQDPLHRTFSVVAYGDTVWIGSASGIASSFDNGQTWTNHKVRLDPDGGQPLPGNISGNWVVTLERQILPEGGSVIWAGTNVTATPQAQAQAISFSRDNGQTWTAAGPTFAWDFAFAPSRVWASTNQGLFSSTDDGLSWQEEPVEDPLTRERLRGTFNGLALANGVLWAGAENGLGRTEDDGQSWTVVKSPVKTISLDRGTFIGQTGLFDSVRTYAAPNPFAPGRDEQARIIYSLEDQDQVTIEIFDFSSRLVRTLIRRQSRPGPQNHGENWDGLDDDGDSVANGVYFYRIELGSGGQAHGKVVVLD